MFKQVNAVHLRPTDRQADAWFGDPVPFYWDGVWHLFYVWDQGHLILPRVCHSWGHFVSRDLVHWEEYPMAIDPGEEASCGTGTVMERDGVFHLFYLGRYFTTYGVMYETMCHATSTDLIHWRKDPGNPISLPDTTRYATRDWRDGFPIWNPEAQEWWMLLTCSLNSGPAAYRGCVGLLASTDFVNWEPRDPFWAPHMGRHLECPDLFFWNGWWYLLFSGGYGHTFGTLYRKSRNMTGPWESPAVDSFDGPSFYAAKTAGDASRRMIFGWVGTRKDDVDHGGTQWGGHGLVRELVQDPVDGTLWVKCPAERLQMGTALPLPDWKAQLGDWQFADGAATVTWNGDLSYATAAVPKNFIARFRFTPASAATQRFGFLLRTNDDLTSGYRVYVSPHSQRFGVNAFAAPEGPQVPTVERPLLCEPGAETTVTVFFSDSILEVFVNDRAALVLRLYNFKGDRLGLFVHEGGGTFSDLEMRALPEETW